jgi:hypothetical protein
MTALAQEKMSTIERWTYHRFTLTSGTKAWKNAALGIELGTGKLKPMAAGVGLLYIGRAERTVDATAADKPVNVNLGTEIEVEWFANSSSADQVLPADLGLLAYFYDDQTVGIVNAGRSVAGRIWAVDAGLGVAVQKLEGARPLGLTPAVAAFSLNDWAPAAIANGAVYDVPTTGAASTITLPAGAPSGTIAYFHADGVKNGHTVQYRDATGPLNLSAALTASKRHVAIAVKRGAAWAVTVTVAP